MAITRIGEATAAATSVSLPAHQAGDLILIFAVRDNSATSPTLPSGYTSIAANGSNSVAIRGGYKIAASSSETSGTWSGATSVHAHVLRGVDNTTPTGGSSTGTAASTSVAYNTFTMTNGGGTSWVAAVGANLDVTNAIESAPTGMTNRTDQVVSTTSEAASHDTNGAVASWSTQSVTIATSARWRTLVVEVLAAVTSISGTASVTLGAVTLSAAGALAIAGTVSASLGALTASGTGALAIAGQGSATLDALTLSGSGAVAISGALAVTLGELTASGSGGSGMTGALNGTLGALTLSAAGVLPITATAAITLDPATLAAAGLVSAGAAPPGDFAIAPSRLLAADGQGRVIAADARPRIIVFGD